MSSEHTSILFRPVLLEKETLVGRNKNITNTRKMERDFTKYRQNV
jgi:hypothetical protein